MRQRTTRDRGNGRFIAVFLLAALGLLAAGSYVQSAAGFASPFYVPVASAVGGLSDGAGGIISSLSNLSHLAGQNQALRQKNARLTRDNAMLPVYERGYTALSRILHFHRLNPPLQIVTAERIGGSPVGLGSSIVVDSGSDQGVHVGDPVLDSSGFVLGEITQALPAQATIGLLTSVNVSIPAMDDRTGALGLADTPQGQAPRFDQVLTSNHLKVGDLIVTSSLGNRFPTGAYIGQITRVFKSNVQPMQYATIRTAANLSNPEYVQVITNFPPTARASYSKSVARLLAASK